MDEERDRPDTELVITPQMIEAGILVAREHTLGEELSELVTRVYMAMHLERSD